MTSEIKVGDLVWAKLRYCPAWPAKVVDHPQGVIKKKSYYVFFYGTENYAWIKQKDISSYVNGYEIKRNFRSEPYRKAVKEIANIYHEFQLKNDNFFLKTQKRKRTVEEEEEGHRKIQERLKVQLSPKKDAKNKVSNGKKSTLIDAASSSSISSSSSIPSTIKVHDFKKYFIRELSVRLQRIDVDADIPCLSKDSDAPECGCVEDEPPTLLPEK